MFKIGICEDHLQSLERLSILVKDICQKHHIDIKIHCFQSGEDLLNFYEQHSNYFDILFLDVLLGEIDGIHIAKVIQQSGASPLILYVSNSKEHALDSYEVYAYSYLLKPYNTAMIEEKILAMINVLNRQRTNTIFIKRQQDLFTLSLDEVVYFESNLRKITAHFKNGQTLEFYEKLSDFEERIVNTQFIRVHRSYLVHLLYVKNIVQSDVVTTTNTRIPISKKYLQPTRDAFTEYIRTHI